MAGDWIKVEKATIRKREVLQIAGQCGIHPDHALGMVVRWFAWCDDNVSDGVIKGMTPDMFVTDFCDGFMEALSSVGWLRVRDGSLEVPNFDRHLSMSAKKRSDAQARKSRARKTEGSGGVSHKNVTKSCDKSVTREEKRREENNSLSPLLGNLEFRKDWERWKRHRSEKFKPLGASEEDVQLMELGRLGWSPEEAGEVVRFSIARGALNLILNGDHKKLDGAESPEAEKEYDLI